MNLEKKEGYKETKLGWIPEDWSYLIIKKFINQLNGFAFKSDEFNQTNKGTRLCRGINITKGNLRFDEKNEMYWKNPNNLNLDKYLLKDRDIVISMDGSLVGRNYSMVNEKYLPLLLVQRVARVRAMPTMSQEFLFHWISSEKFIRYVDSVKTSSGIPHISSKDINNFKILIPPLPEQQKIANILNTWDKAIATQEKLITKKQKLKKGLTTKLIVLQKDKFKNVKLKDVCSKIQDGNYGAKYPKTNEFLETGIPFLTSKALGSGGKIHNNKLNFISENKHKELKKAHLKLNDVLFTNRGANVGAIAIVGQDISNGNIGPQLTLLRASDNIIPSFLRYVMSSNVLRKQILQQDSGSAMNFFGIRDTSKFTIPLPSLIEQQKTVDILDSIKKEIENLEEQLKQFKFQKQGLMQQLLTGQKRVKI